LNNVIKDLLHIPRSSVSRLGWSIIENAIANLDNQRVDKGLTSFNTIYLRMKSGNGGSMSIDG
jgi:hypothetical protein